MLHNLNRLPVVYTVPYMPPVEKIGLIAGNGKFPFLVLDAARSQGYDVVVAAIKEETFRRLTRAVRPRFTGFLWANSQN